MALAQIHSRALLGWQAGRVVVEVHIANGLPSFTLVGMADTAVREARERVRSAIAHSNLVFPATQRLTVSLAPADLPKDSGRFDLPIALGVLVVAGQLPADALHGFEFAGELSLSGELRPVRGAVALALQVARETPPDGQKRPTLVLPIASAREAARVPGVSVVGATDLASVVQALLNRARPVAAEDPHTDPEPVTPPQGWRPLTTPPFSATAAAPGLCLSDVRGQVAARRALEVAAAGGHSLLLVGPPGTGKSMLAARLAGILPPLTEAEALDVAALASVAGRFDPQTFGQRSTCSPHHSASAVALVGGGSPPRPGEISLAHHGVLFLDELPEFQRSALEALREPLESGRITISRAAQRADFPARFQLVAAMNPCPCGNLGRLQPACRCSPDQVARYRARLSGPLLDRIDLTVEVAAMSASELLHASPADSSAVVSGRVAEARQVAVARQGCANAALPPAQVSAAVRLDAAATEFMARAADRLAWSARATHRALRVARTIADLDRCPDVGRTHLAEALQYRRSLP